MKTSITHKVEWVDALKVVTMILVIVGHSNYLAINTPYGGTPYTNIGYDHPSLIYRLLGVFVSFIYSFHMPLFMAISGMCFNFSMQKDPTWSSILHGKAKRLLLPFILVTLFYSLPIKYFSGYYDHSENVFYDIFMGQILLLGNSHLWYVISLFWIFLAYYFIEKSHIKKNSAFWLALIGISWIGKYYEVSFNLLGLAAAMKHLFFFALGYNLFYKLDNYHPRTLFKPMIGLLGAFILQRLLFIVDNNNLINKSLSYPFFTIISVIGGGCTLLIIKYLQEKMVNTKTYEAFKKYTYELYLYSDPLNYIIIAMTFALWGVEAYQSNIIPIGLFVFRIITTTVGAFVVIYALRKVKSLISYTNKK